MIRSIQNFLKALKDTFYGEYSHSKNRYSLMTEEDLLKAISSPTKNDIVNLSKSIED